MSKKPWAFTKARCLVKEISIGGGEFFWGMLNKRYNFLLNEAPVWSHHSLYFAISHKQLTMASIFLPFVTLSFSTFCGWELLPCAVCASHTRFLPAFLAWSKAQNSLPASFPQQPSCTGVTGSRGQGQVGTLQACPDPQLLCVATSSPQPICWQQEAECPPFPSGSELSATGARALAAPAGSEVERVSSRTLSAPVWGKGAGTIIPCRSTNPALGAGMWKSSRASAISQNSDPQALCAGPVLCCIMTYSLWKGFNITFFITKHEKQEKAKEKQTLTVHSSLQFPDWAESGVDSGVLPLPHFPTSDSTNTAL